MSHKNFIFLGKKLPEMKFTSLNLNRLETNLVKTVNVTTGNNKTRNAISRFKMAGNIDKKNSGHQQLEAKFKMQPVSFFVRSIHNGGVDKENLKDEKEKECHKITKDNLQNKIDYTNKSPKDKIIEVDESNEWNE
ncbi:hypothetical protein RFI_02780, partial [Reticulomyxa filosa]